MDMELSNLLAEDILQAITTAQAITQELGEMCLSDRNIQACMTAWEGMAMMMWAGIPGMGMGTDLLPQSYTEELKLTQN